MQEEKPTSPQAKVLTTPELLEGVLLHLDMRTLLVSAQRVCQSWAALIKNSPAIQQALFFRPAASLSKIGRDELCAQEHTSRYQCSSYRPIYNPLLIHAFRPFFPSIHEYPNIQDSGEYLFKDEVKKERKDLFHFERLDLFTSPQKKIAYMRAEASWRKMLPRQPAVYSDITIFQMTHAMGGDSHTCYKLPQNKLNAGKMVNMMVDSANDNALRMDHLFTTLSQNSDLDFGMFGQTYIYWSAHLQPYEPGDRYYPPHRGSFQNSVKSAFVKATEESEVIIFSRNIQQCGPVWGQDSMTGDESLRSQIAQVETPSPETRGESTSEYNFQNMASQRELMAIAAKQRELMARQRGLMTTS